MKYIKIFFLLSTLVLFVSCGENTKNPVTPDIASVKIVDTSNTSGFIYATDPASKLNATVTYTDGTSSDASDFVTWNNTDFSLLTMYRGEYAAIANGGKATISIEYADFRDSFDVKVYALKAGTLSIVSSSDINATGTYIIEAKGDFTDLDTNTTVDTNRTIVKNIIWSATNDAVVTIVDDTKTELTIINTGETNVTATVFDINITNTYTIN